MTVTRPIASSRDEMLWEIRREVANSALPVLVGVGVVAMLLAEGLGWPRSVHFFSATLLLFPLLVWLLSRRSYLLAMWLLVLGYTLAGLLIGRWIPGAAALCLLAMPAIFAAILIGSWGSLAVAILSTLLVLSPLRQHLRTSSRPIASWPGSRIAWPRCTRWQRRHAGPRNSSWPT